MKVKMTTLRSILLSFSGICFASTLLAAEPPPPPAIGETWGCTYKDGKGFDDKMKARDYMVAQIEKAGLTAVPGYHMTQIKGMAPVDTLWMDVHPNLEAYGKNTTAWEASGIGAGVQARFDAVEDCTAGLSVLRRIHQQDGDDEEGDNTSMVANLACTYREGSGPQHMADLTRHMGAVMGNMGSDGPGFAYLRTPITGGANFPDLFLTSVFDDTEHWTRYVMQLFSTEEGERMRSHMDMVVDCNISIWRSQQVVTPAAE